MYGATFDRQWSGTSPDRLAEIWAEEISDLTGQEIAAGLQACRARPLPPTMPEFRIMCRPEVDPYTAFREAAVGMEARARELRGDWTHPAIYWAAVRIGTHDLLNIGYQRLRLHWEKVLREEFARGQWPEIPNPAPALPAPGQTLATRAEAAAAMEHIRRETGLDPQQQPSDKRAWARRIVDDHQRKGGRRYSAAVLDMAKQAAGMVHEVL
ncbi:hypothetical protein [Corticimicrobacter populi]|uniref:Uncharacterized protein n=1 Tax=Corticimicrobacter populi TaxID=2175229 RepID=A0A2V1K7U6_9BURK|nr:hypothetical protein [Corticimicrobacter populi]PWF25042.1 hypothetical protein DD235_02410 [Corticimicrobacter populi]